MSKNINVEKTVEQETEIDLLEVLFQLLQHWKAIAASMILLALVFFAGSKLFITPMYESTSELYVLTKSTSITSLADLQTGTSLTNDYIVVLTGRPVLDQVIKNLNLDKNYGALKSMVNVSNPSNSRILQITVKSADAKQAKEIADELAEVSAAFIAEKMDQDPPSIIQYGYVNSNPVSPNSIKNAVIGALLGFVIAAGFVIITNLLDDSIMTAEDIERKLELNVLGQLPLVEAEDDGHSSGHSRRNRKKRKG